MNKIIQDTPEKNIGESTPSFNEASMTHGQLIDLANKSQSIGERVAGKMLLLMDVWHHKTLGQK